MTTPSTPTQPLVVFLDSDVLSGHGDLDLSPLHINGVRFKQYPRTASEDIVERAAQAEVIVTNKCQFTAEILARLPRLRLILEAATGYDNIDITAARQQHIDVCNVAGYARMPVAQTIVAYLLDHCNRVAHYAHESRQGAWTQCKDFCRLAHPTLELHHKRVAIVGFGSIGATLAEMLRPFGTEVFAVTSKKQTELPTYVKKISLEKAFATCFAVSLNCPLTPSTREFVNKSLLAHAHPDLLLINTARGAVVNEYDVAQALYEDRLGAYYADVLCQEPPKENNPLLSAPRCHITPHVAWATIEARNRILQALAQNLQAFLQGKPLNNIVN